MKKILLSLLLLPFLHGVPIFAQTLVVQAVKSELVTAGADLNGACGALRITNEVAKRTGLKLLRKTGGYRAVPQPDGTCLDGDNSALPDGYATDYLIDLQHGAVGYDILGDGGGANIEQWSGPENAADMVQRNINSWRDPIASWVVAKPAPPVVVVPPPVPPVPAVTPPAAVPVATPAPAPSVVEKQKMSLRTLLLYILGGTLAAIICSRGACGT